MRLEERVSSLECSLRSSGHKKGVKGVNPLFIIYEKVSKKVSIHFLSFMV